MTDTVKIGRLERVLAVLVQAAPVLCIPLWILFSMLSSDGTDNYGNLFFLFFWGLPMLAGGLVVALVSALVARRGFLRAQALGSLRFHGMVAAIALPVTILLGYAFAVQGIMQAAGPAFALFGVVLPLAEIARSVICGTSAARAQPASP